MSCLLRITYLYCIAQSLCLAVLTKRHDVLVGVCARCATKPTMSSSVFFHRRSILHLTTYINWSFMQHSEALHNTWIYAPTAHLSFFFNLARKVVRLPLFRDLLEANFQRHRGARGTLRGGSRSQLTFITECGARKAKSFECYLLLCSTSA